jgi:hypothetical protein
MKRYTNIAFFAVTLCFMGSVAAPIAAQTVVGPEYTLTKPSAVRLEKGEKQCEYFLRTMLGGNVQRISFNHVAASSGKIESEVPPIGNVTIVIVSTKNVPTARITDTDEDGRFMWQLTMSQDLYVTNQQCLAGITKLGG